MAARLGRNPTNAWMAAPNYAQPGSPAPEVSCRMIVLLVVIGSWVGVGRGGIQVEYGAPPMILEPKVLNVLVLMGIDI